MVPMKTSHQGERRKPLRLAPEPKVGIVWLVDGKLVIDNTLLAKAEDYGAFKVHPGDHCSVWEKFQRGGAVPADMEYEECPRGRVTYDTKARRFRLLADRCILSNEGCGQKNHVGDESAQQNHRQGRRRPLSVLRLLAPTVGVKEKSATRFISIACEVVDSCRCSVY